ncbi:MAG: arylesterase [Lamprobacter sp.]|uniref:arylesterase n=1 Tax=Lamprobacter sp. TaxID=3100796 RepID=UPI002B2576E8|nr:arylesterase [Lamprobacter sp.]MEA3641018.1 arylesterase [Lamprobacter sp.]
MLRLLLSLLLLLPLAAITEASASEPMTAPAFDQGQIDRVAEAPIAEAIELTDEPTEAKESVEAETAAEAAEPIEAAEPAQAAGQTDAPVLLVLGDSLSAAYGLPLDQGWVSLLQARIDERGLPHRVVNAAISGDTVAGGLSRLPALLAEHQPAILLIELGANDGLRGFPPAKIEDDLVTLVEQAQAADAQVVLVGLRLPPNYGPAYTERFQRLFAKAAERTGVALVPRLLAGVAEDLALMQADGLHPTAEAQPMILGTVWPVLEPLLKGAD